jgi:hypothetical protein
VADAKARKLIRKLARESILAPRIIVTGRLAQHWSGRRICPIDRRGRAEHGEAACLRSSASLLPDSAG